MKKLISAILCMMLVLSSIVIVPVSAITPIPEHDPDYNYSEQLMVKGNQLVQVDSQNLAVTLRGINIPSMG